MRFLKQIAMTFWKEVMTNARQKHSPVKAEVFIDINTEFSDDQHQDYQKH